MRTKRERCYRCFKKLKTTTMVPLFKIGGTGMMIYVCIDCYKFYSAGEAK